MRAVLRRQRLISIGNQSEGRGLFACNSEPSYVVRTSRSGLVHKRLSREGVDRLGIRHSSVDHLRPCQQHVPSEVAHLSNTF